MAAEGRMEGRKGEKSTVTVTVCPSVARGGGGKEFKIQTVSLSHLGTLSMEEAISPVTQVCPTRKLKQEVQRRSEKEIESNHGYKLHMRSVSSCAPH